MNKFIEKFKKPKNEDQDKENKEQSHIPSFYSKLTDREKNLISVMISLITIMAFVLLVWSPGIGKIGTLKAEKKVLATQSENMQMLIDNKAKYEEKKGEAMVKLARVQDDFIGAIPAEDIDSMITDIIKESGYTPGDLTVELVSSDEAKVTVMAVGNTYSNLMRLIAEVNSRRYIAIDSFEAIIAGETDPKGATSIKKITTTETKTRLVPSYDEVTGAVTYNTEEYTVPKEEYVEVGKEESIQAVKKETNIVFTVKMIPGFNQ